MKKRVISLILTMVMLMAILPLAGGEAAALFTPRTTAPATDNRYYIVTSAGGLNECVVGNGGGNSALPNCVGYAWGRAYEITGTRPRLSRGNAKVWYGNTGDGYARGSTPKLGAIMCWTDSGDHLGHLAVVEEINTNGQIKYSDSTWSGIRFRYSSAWVTPPAVGSKTYPYSDGATRTFQGYIYIGDFQTVPIPSNPTITVDKGNNSTYALNDTVLFTYSAKDATGYVIGIDRDGVRVVTQDVPAAGYSYKATQTGSYSAYVSCRNSTGFVDSAKVNFTVSQPKPSNPVISIDKGNYGAYTLNEEVLFNYSANDATNYTIYIDKDGERVFALGVPSKGYNYKAVRTGNYSAYVTCYNANYSAGSVDTASVYFTVAAVSGDVSGDGAVNMQDVVLSYQSLRGKTVLTPEQLQAADVNYDGRVNMQDALLVYQYFRGKISSFPQPQLSDWTRAEDMPEGAHVSERKWTYTITDTFQSTNSAEPGAVKTGEVWAQTAIGTIDYATFPSGFDKTHSIYNSYNKQPVTAYENAATKRTVTVSRPGFIYWHWTYEPGSPTSSVNNRRIQSYQGYDSSSGYNFQYFHAVVSDQDYPFVASANAYQWNGGGIYWTWWWFRIDINRCSFVDYTKYYAYARTQTKESGAYPEETDAAGIQEWVRYTLSL